MREGNGWEGEGLSLRRLPASQGAGRHALACAVLDFLDKFTSGDKCMAEVGACSCVVFELLNGVLRLGLIGVEVGKVQFWLWYLDISDIRSLPGSIACDLRGHESLEETNRNNRTIEFAS